MYPTMVQKSRLKSLQLKLRGAQSKFHLITGVGMASLEDVEVSSS